MARLAEALEHAHDRGILHRDIKPSNVLVIDDGMPMLLDFNLARESVVGDENGPGGAGEVTLGGTVDYMAPEHLEALAEGVSERVDGRSDIYGLGVLLYEAVVGKKPFLPPRKSHSVIECLLRAADERRRDTSALFPDSAPIPAPLQAVIRRCLEPEALDRYQRAADLAADLRAVADDLPLVHAREPILSRLGRRLRRNRRRLAMAAIVFLAGAAILGAYVNYQFDRFDRFNDVNASYLQGDAAIDRGDFKEAQIWLDNAATAGRPFRVEAVPQPPEMGIVLGVRRQAPEEARIALDLSSHGGSRGQDSSQGQDGQADRHHSRTGRCASGKLRGPAVPADRPGGGLARSGDRAEAVAPALLRSGNQERRSDTRAHLGPAGCRAAGAPAP